MSSQQTQQTQEVKETVEPATQEIPILDVDRAQSVDERFTDNAINNILPARYLVKDSSGTVV